MEDNSKYRVVDTVKNKPKGFYTDEQEAKMVSECYNRIDYINTKVFRKRYIVKEPVDLEFDRLLHNFHNTQFRHIFNINLSHLE